MRLLLKSKQAGDLRKRYTIQEIRTWLEEIIISCNPTISRAALISTLEWLLECEYKLNFSHQATQVSNTSIVFFMWQNKPPQTYQCEHCLTIDDENPILFAEIQ